MEQTFMTIHNLTIDANILFASDSITDILGYQPDEVEGKSCFDYFHPDEVPFARSVHSRGVLLDKAAVLHYCRIFCRGGQWVSCECCFTIVHDVLVASTSIYRRGEKSQRRAIEAPQIRRIFSCSPRDPRYHMLEHLSPRFKMPPMEREPRAALILNRFTRNLTVMFATNAVSSILGLTPAQIRHKSFYRCIQENCLAEALRCLEGAKANDSIAYLRFWSRDPRDEQELGDEERGGGDTGGHGSDAPQDADPSGHGGSGGGTAMDIDSGRIPASDTGGSEAAMGEGDTTMGPFATIDSLAARAPSRSPISPPRSPPYAGEAAQGGEDAARSYRGRPSRRQRLPSIELEAVVSCTSDGLVVVLRKARPPIPAPHPPLLPFEYGNGLFAAPWASQPIRPCLPPEMLYTFRPPLLPQYMPLRENVKAAGGPPLDQLMRSIRDVAVFAWALVGINGNLGAYAHGLPRGEASPADGSSPWGKSAGNASFSRPEGQAPTAWPPKGGQSANAPAAPAGAPRPPPLYGPDASRGYAQPARLGVDGHNHTRQPAWAPSQPSRYGADQRRHYPAAQQPLQAPRSSQCQPRRHVLADMPQEPWREASAAASPGHGPDLASPTSPAPTSPGDAPPSRSFRDMWE